MTKPCHLPINIAAANLSRAVFGEHRAYKRKGGVRVQKIELVLRMIVPETEWPKARAAYLEGHPVQWQQITRKVA